MRKVILQCPDGTSFSISREVEDVFAVMQIGKAVDAITYEVRLNGTQVKEFLTRQRIPYPCPLFEEQSYLLIAYDW